MLTKLNTLSEFFLYVLIFGITFSNAAVESSIGFILFFFIIKRILAKNIKPPKTRLNFILCVFFTVIFISFLRSAYFNESVRGMVRALKYILLYFALVDLFDGDGARIKRFFWVSVFISGFTFLNGIFQSIFGFDFMRHRALEKLDYLSRIKASFVHPNDFGTYIISVLPLSLAFFSNCLCRKKKAFLIMICILGFYCLLKTSSRGAWLGFLVAIFVYFFYHKKKISLAIPIVILLCIIIFPHGFGRLVNSFKLESNTLWERTQLWKGTWNMVKEHPLAGFGINTFSNYFPKYKPPEYWDLRYTHNSYLQMWSETGIIGLLAFMAMIFAVLRISLRNLRDKIKHGLEGFIFLGALTGYIGFIIHAAVDTSLYSLVLITQFWILNAYIISLNSLLKGYARA